MQKAKMSVRKMATFASRNVRTVANKYQTNQPTGILKNDTRFYCEEAKAKYATPITKDVVVMPALIARAKYLLNDLLNPDGEDKFLMGFLASAAAIAGIFYYANLEESPTKQITPEPIPML